MGKNLESLDMNTMASDARKALDSVGMNIDEYTTVHGLPVGYMQFVEIAREIDKTGMKLLVFDEPTAVLTESEATQLISVMKKIAESGIAIIFITHRLDEVMAASNNITILRDGKLVATRKVEDTSIVELAELMIGRKGEAVVDAQPRSVQNDKVALHLGDLRVDMPGEAVRGITLDVYEGEILGIGGLAGQGKVGIPNGILGLYPAEGEIIFDGEKVEPSKLGDALHKGIAFVSEDRRGVGLLLNESIEQNIIFTALQIQSKFLKKYGPFTQFDAKGAKQHALEMIKALDIRCTGPEQYAGRLSGGNQQKVCLARAITMEPKLLIVSEPTRGIDIGAKKLVLELLAKMNREQGMTIIMVSSELNELRSLCDRIAIVSDGKLTGIFAPEASDAEYGLAMSGVTEGGKV